MKNTSLLIALCLTASSSFALDDSSAMQQMQQDTQSAMDMDTGTQLPKQKKLKPGEVIPMVKDALPRLQNLQKLIWISKFRIETFQNQKEKSMFLERASIILESLQKDMIKAGLNSPKLRQSPEALVYGWQQEGYANALNVTYQLDVDTCRLATQQSMQRFKARASGIKGLMWRGKKSAQQLIGQLQQYCNTDKDREIILKNSGKSVENAMKFNEIYKQFNTILRAR